MDADLFAEMLLDDCMTDLQKLQSKYPDADIQEFLELLKKDFYCSLPLHDPLGRPLVYLEGPASAPMSAVMAYSASRSTDVQGWLEAMATEISSSLALENIHVPSDNVEQIIRGEAPEGEAEVRAFGMKNGLEFISDTDNKITSQNISNLYQLAIGDYLETQAPACAGAHTQQLAALAHFANNDDSEHPINDLIKAALINFYFISMQPYPQSNGLMGRLMHQWFLTQQGYPATLAIPISLYISKTSQAYDQALAQIEQNAAISALTDVTPFLVYFSQNVYNQLSSYLTADMYGEY